MNKQFEPGQVWYDASDYIPGYGQVTVIGVRGALVMLEKFIGWSTNRERFEMPIKEFVERFKRVPRFRGES